TADDARDRVAAEVLLDALAERLVEVRARRALGPGVGERVARAALLDEQQLAGREVGVAVVDRAAAHDQGGCHHEQDACFPRAGHRRAELYPRFSTEGSASRSPVAARTTASATASHE